MSQRININVITIDGVQVPVKVLMGWDRPLQQLFMVVEIINDEDVEKYYEAFEEGIVYSNLFDAAPNKDLAYYKDKLKTLEIIVPESMLIGVEKDREFNMGNHVVTHE